MPTKCKFEFDRSVSVYYTGESITGRVTLTTTSEKLIKGVYIRFEGKGKVGWSNGNSTHSDSEDYVDIRTHMRDEGILSIGSYNYKFALPIPENCPSSCYKKHGKIHYEVSLVINRYQVYNNKFSQPLTVLQTNDLNFQPELLLPIREEKIKYLCCWSCKKAQILLTVTIPFGGYAPGQDIVYTLDINNQTKDYDKYEYFIDVKLRESCLYTASWSSKKTHATLAAVEHTLTRTGSSMRTMSGSLSIPPIPPSSCGQHIIMISYFIAMNITCSKRKRFDLKIPIVIGTKPIELNKRGEPRKISSILHKKSFDLLRPTYEQFSKSADNDDFRPKYPMYKTI